MQKPRSSMDSTSVLIAMASSSLSGVHIIIASVPISFAFSLFLIKEWANLLILNKAPCIRSKGYISAKEERQSQWYGDAE